MASRLTRIQQGLWYDAECKFCGGPVDYRNVDSYRAIPSYPGEESLEHAIPVLNSSNPGGIIIGPLTASRIRLVGRLPKVYLTHLRCIKIFRNAMSCETAMISLLTIICILVPTCSVDITRSHPLSVLDGNALAAIFSPTNRPS